MPRPNRPRHQRARETERTAATYLARRIWPRASAVGSGEAGSDIQHVPVDIEVKARRDFSPLAWVRQSRKRRPGGFVICRPDGLGPESVGDWLVIKRLDDEIDLRLQVDHLIRSLDIANSALLERELNDTASPVPHLPAMAIHPTT